LILKTCPPGTGIVGPDGVSRFPSPELTWRANAKQCLKFIAEDLRQLCVLLKRDEYPFFKLDEECLRKQVQGAANPTAEAVRIREEIRDAIRAAMDDCCERRAREAIDVLRGPDPSPVFGGVPINIREYHEFFVYFTRECFRLECSKLQRERFPCLVVPWTVSPLEADPDSITYFNALAKRVVDQYWRALGWHGFKDCWSEDFDRRDLWKAAIGQETDDLTNLKWLIQNSHLTPAPSVEALDGKIELEQYTAICGDYLGVADAECSQSWSATCRFPVLDMDVGKDIEPLLEEMALLASLNKSDINGGGVPRAFDSFKCEDCLKRGQHKAYEKQMKERNAPVLSYEDWKLYTKYPSAGDIAFCCLEKTLKMAGYSWREDLYVPAGERSIRDAVQEFLDAISCSQAVPCRPFDDGADSGELDICKPVIHIRSLTPEPDTCSEARDFEVLNVIAVPTDVANPQGDSSEDELSWNDVVSQGWTSNNPGNVQVQHKLANPSSVTLYVELFFRSKAVMQVHFGVGCDCPDYSKFAISRWA